MATLSRTASNRWQAIVRIKGPEGDVLLRKKTFPRKTDARYWAEETERAIRNGRISFSSQAKVSDLIDTWIRRRLPQLKGDAHRRQRRSQVEWWRERIGSQPVEKVTTSIVARHLDTLEVAPSTRNRYKSALGAVYRLAIERGDLQRSDNPTVGIHERERNARTRWLDANERERLFAAIADHPDLPLLVRIALTTGMRKGEITRMRWRDLDFGRHLISIPETKNGRVRSAPIHPKVENQLRDRQKEKAGTEFVFEGPSGRPHFPRKAWDKAVEKADLDNFRFHDLRHTAASLQARRGASLNELKTLFGHETLEMVIRYAHMVDNEVAAAARQRLVDLAL